MNLVFTDEAAADLRDIVLFLEETDMTSGPFQADLAHALKHLRRWPESGTRREDLTRKQNIRFWLVEPYQIAYLAEGGEIVTVIGIIHCSRDIRRVVRHRVAKDRP